MRASAEGRIRRARPDEARALRELTQRSQAHWGGSQAFLDEADRLLQLGPEQLERDEVWVAESGGEPLGWFRVTFVAGSAELEELFVEPAEMGQGIGRRLFEHAVSVSGGHGVTRLEWDSNRQAEGFYRHMGGRAIGEKRSMIEGDPLVRMRLEL